MALKKRQKDILLKIIEEYIQLAEPISSRFLKERYSLPFSTATLRLEMHDLTEKGFLVQPHTSAGRVPTDKGYRVFVNELAEELIEKEIDDFKVGECFKKDCKNEIVFFQYLVKKLSEISKSLISAYLEKEEVCLEAGWQDIIKEPEFQDKNYLFDFANFLKKLEGSLENLKISSDLTVYIGSEIPIKEGKEFSLILFQSTLPEIGKTILSLSGPQRMDYNKNIKILKSLKKYLQNL